ncbi:MAG: tRNA-intron lyase [Candidatus Woesearchaeota archaeon]|nr:MAG: tRNA-intron lyase [Candidatus Woesearchaeota archaeon]
MEKIDPGVATVPEEKQTKKKVVPTLMFVKGTVVASDTEEALDLYATGRFGYLAEDNSLHFSLNEALFLLEKGRATVLDGRRQVLDKQIFIKRAERIEPNFFVRYAVYRDMRGRGYIVKTALKFGGDFRVYDRGVKPGDDHARWILYPVSEGSVLTWHEFAAKNRVAHSTKKRLLIGVVDDEGDISYWEIRWIRP